MSEDKKSIENRWHHWRGMVADGFSEQSCFTHCGEIAVAAAILTLAEILKPPIELLPMFPQGIMGEGEQPQDEYALEKDKPPIEQGGL